MKSLAHIRAGFRPAAKQIRQQSSVVRIARVRPNQYDARRAWKIGSENTGSEPSLAQKIAFEKNEEVKTNDPVPLSESIFDDASIDIDKGITRERPRGSDIRDVKTVSGRLRRANPNRKTPVERNADTSKNAESAVLKAAHSSWTKEKNVVTPAKEVRIAKAISPKSDAVSSTHPPSNGVERIVRSSRHTRRFDQLKTEESRLNREIIKTGEKSIAQQERELATPGSVSRSSKSRPPKSEPKPMQPIVSSAGSLASSSSRAFKSIPIVTDKTGNDPLENIGSSPVEPSVSSSGKQLVNIGRSMKKPKIFAQSRSLGTELPATVFGKLHNQLTNAVISFLGSYDVSDTDIDLVRILLGKDVNIGSNDDYLTIRTHREIETTGVTTCYKLLETQKIHGRKPRSLGWVNEGMPPRRLLKWQERLGDEGAAEVDALHSRLLRSTRIRYDPVVLLSDPQMQNILRQEWRKSADILSYLRALSRVQSTKSGEKKKQPAESAKKPVASTNAIATDNAIASGATSDVIAQRLQIETAVLNFLCLELRKFVERNGGLEFEQAVDCFLDLRMSLPVYYQQDRLLVQQKMPQVYDLCGVLLNTSVLTDSSHDSSMGSSIQHDPVVMLKLLKLLSANPGLLGKYRCKTEVCLRLLENFSDIKILHLYVHHILQILSSLDSQNPRLRSFFYELMVNRLRWAGMMKGSRDNKGDFARKLQMLCACLRFRFGGENAEGPNDIPGKVCLKVLHKRVLQLLDSISMKSIPFYIKGLTDQHLTDPSPMASGSEISQNSLRISHGIEEEVRLESTSTEGDNVLENPFHLEVNEIRDFILSAELDEQITRKLCELITQCYLNSGRFGVTNGVSTSVAVQTELLMTFGRYCEINSLCTKLDPHDGGKRYEPLAYDLGIHALPPWMDNMFLSVADNIVANKKNFLRKDEYFRTHAMAIIAFMSAFWPKEQAPTHRIFQDFANEWLRSMQLLEEESAAQKPTVSSRSTSVSDVEQLPTNPGKLSSDATSATTSHTLLGEFDFARIVAQDSKSQLLMIDALGPYLSEKYRMKLARLACGTKARLIDEVERLKSTPENAFSAASLEEEATGVAARAYQRDEFSDENIDELSLQVGEGAEAIIDDGEIIRDTPEMQIAEKMLTMNEKFMEDVIGRLASQIQALQAKNIQLSKDRDQVLTESTPSVASPVMVTMPPAVSSTTTENVTSTTRDSPSSTAASAGSESSAASSVSSTPLEQQISVSKKEITEASKEEILRLVRETEISRLEKEREEELSRLNAQREQELSQLQKQREVDVSSTKDEIALLQQQLATLRDSLSAQQQDNQHKLDLILQKVVPASMLRKQAEKNKIELHGPGRVNSNIPLSYTNRRRDGEENVKVEALLGATSKPGLKHHPFGTPKGDARAGLVNRYAINNRLTGESQEQSANAYTKYLFALLAKPAKFNINGLFTGQKQKINVYRPP